MVKALQKKFTVTAMAAVSVLLTVLISSINIANCWMYSRQTNQQLNMLTDTEKQIMQQEQRAFEPEQFPKPPMKEEHGKGSIFNPPIDEDTAMSLRFFAVCLGRKSQVLHKDISRISSVSGSEAEEYAQQAVQKDKRKGYIRNFKYRITEADDTGIFEAEPGTILIFLDVSGQLRSLLMVFIVSVSIAVICWLFMLLLVILLSRRAIRPIAQSIQKQKQFVTDAGHELKTPLAIIQANIDAMELISGENKWSRNIKNQSLRLSGLMQNLLTLAKMDEGGQELQLTDFSVSALSDESLQPFYEAAALRGIVIETEIQPEVFMHANREYIQRLLSILFDNAVKYTDSGGRITVSVHKADKTNKNNKGSKKDKTDKTDKTAVIQVKNTCEELPVGDADKLFDRFYRADSARTQKNGGYGIGLSAAYAIVTAHKGSIRAQYPDRHTIVFTVKI